MQDSELKKLLLETCPVRPGQEARAWSALWNRLSAASPSDRYWLYFPTWSGLAVAGSALILVGVLGNYYLMGFQPVSLATADSQSPGIYATAFYSHSAQAQVVWLNGLEPATDKPTYLDPTTVLSPATKSSGPVRDSNSL